MKLKIITLIIVAIAIYLGVFAYNYGLKFIKDERANAIISLGESMAENDIKSGNLRWFWYSEGWETNEIASGNFEKKYKIKINWDMASIPDDYKWRESYNKKINEHLKIKFGKEFYVLYDEIYRLYK